MKNRLTVSFGEAADRERKHPDKEASGIRGARAPGRRVAWAFVGPLALGLSPIGALGLGQLARGTKPRPMVPTMPPFFLLGRVIVLDWKKGQA